MQICLTLILTGHLLSAQAQEVSVPDPGLNAAIREALQKANGPLTEQDLLSLTNLDARRRDVSNIAGLEAARNLTELNLDFNRFTSLSLPTNLTRLSALHLRGNLLTSFNLPPESTELTYLDLSTNQLTNVTLPAGLAKLSILALSQNKFTSFAVPPGLRNLGLLTLGGNQLTNVVLPSDLGHLVLLDLGGNRLATITVPAGLTNLFGLFLNDNQLINITLPSDLTQLGALGYLRNPLTTLVLPEFLAETTLAAELPALRNLGVSVFTYPLTLQLVGPRLLSGAFQIGVTGPPGDYVVFASTNLPNWSALGFATNKLGAVNFTDATAHLFPQRYYRLVRQFPPPQMVFIPSNTFLMGSPGNEQDRDINEGPQTRVTLTRGFWIGKYEVTQAEYLSVVGINPSQFPGDLQRPVSSVSWPDATNYCWLLTQRALAAGSIPPGSRYRLPTEAEWECAARAGTTTRFSYGNDPFYADLAKYAWQTLDDGLTVHPVGQKLPNPWGLHDMMGNVFEWCQDWLGPLPGGSVTDPQGAASNPIGWKIMRGGAFDFGGPTCRSASRMFFGNHPALTDWNLGFRVVLVADPQ